MGTLWVSHYFTNFCGGGGDCNHLLQFPTTTLTLSLPPTTLANFQLRASQTTTTTTTTRTTRIRKSRRLKSDAEICDDIRLFLASVGLPEDHIPSTKELLHHGRNELANIVRRRGHKQIKELLTSSLNAGVHSLDPDKSFDERRDAANECESLLTGQNERVDSQVDEDTASTEFLSGNSSSSLCTGSTLSLDGCTSVPLESLANSTVEDGLGELNDHAEDVNNVAEGNFYSSEVITVDNDCSSPREGFYPSSYSQSSMPTEISGETSSVTTSSGNSECEDRLVGKTAGHITLPSTVPSMENHSNTSFTDSDIDTGDKELSHLLPTFDLSLEKKDWYALEGLDDSNDNITEDVSTTSEFSIRGNLSGENKINSVTHSAESSSINLDNSANLSLEERVANFIQNGDLDPVEDHVSGISNGDGSQENKVNIESKPVVDMPLDAHPPKDNNGMPLIGNTEASEVQNQSEINHLKFMLKELELSRLKEQIEKEKLALAVLQTKAEAEISKARNLIAEKDADLRVAEESLPGLKEVQIDFCGDADVVEVAGSFNGWSDRIKMDPQPSAGVIDLVGSRKPKIWSTTLWLYPGVFEIKFVVDGDWRTDPQRESVTRGHICNNILIVDR
ncbi:protein PTST homolog 3, chloroplastic isoform X2 [Lotus japonicus]|uniref:protein PTST homolog 3, chloroplastic isoform X2 n=1 Tax=Lotus japonicus TaxID=34305 RepID=UPI00258667BE|nr:protein PTST homolog 3, chloroplastic isoform X2 [Lotus japonicus]